MKNKNLVELGTMFLERLAALQDMRLRYLKMAETPWEQVQKISNENISWAKAEISRRRDETNPDVSIKPKTLTELEEEVHTEAHERFLAIYVPPFRSRLSKDEPIDEIGFTPEGIIAHCIMSYAIIFYDSTDDGLQLKGVDRDTLDLIAISHINGKTGTEKSGDIGRLVPALDRMLKLCDKKPDWFTQDEQGLAKEFRILLAAMKHTVEEMIALRSSIQTKLELTQGAVLKAPRREM